MKNLVALVFILLFISFAVVRMVADIQFDRGCEGYLKRAADANTVELAAENLKVAVDYLDKNNIKSGYTSIIYTTPDEDIGWWVRNLKKSLDELYAVDPNASQLEKSNVLMKLRETLLDSGDKSVHVTCPSGITIYPNNGFFAIWGTLSFLLMWLGIGMLYEENY